MKTALLLSLLAAAMPAIGAPAMFPKPLHLVKRVEDPLAPRVRSVDQYCAGNRIVTISGARVSIVDYDAQTVTDIDHAAATWSVTRFDELAAAHPKNAVSASTSAIVTASGMKSSAGGRSVDSFDIQAGQGKLTLGVDRSVALSRAAVEALIGAAYPDIRRPEHDAMLRAAAPPSSGGRAVAKSVNEEDAYALPSEQLLTLRADGGAVTIRTSVLRFDSELAPAAALLIDPGATRIESSTQRFAREMHDADTVPLAH